MKKKAKVKSLVAGKELPQKRAYDTDSSRHQSGDSGGRGGASGLLLTWPCTCLAYHCSLTNPGPEGCSCPPHRVGQSEAAVWESWPGLMNN